MSPELTAALAIAGAALGGAAVGLEREWSGHARGADARFAGIRTFTLLGGLAGICGWSWSRGAAPLATVLLAGAVALVVAAYLAASRRHIEGTTEVAALVVLAAGVLAGTGRLVLASGIIAVTSLVLVEKTRLHAWVSRIDDAELRAGIRFAVMAVVILPLLPEGPYGPSGGVRPRELWALVLVFSGLSFAGYVARRAVGPRRGYLVTGLLGGFVSSTSVSLVFARTSVEPGAPAIALAGGVVAASAVMFLRVLVATAILRWPLALALIPYAILPFAVGTLVALAFVRRTSEPRRTLDEPTNPLQVWSALQMAAMFQIALAAISLVRATWGDLGLLASGAVVGFTDVDALTFSMAKEAAAGAPLPLVATAIAIGMLSNTLLKLGITLALGRGRYRVAAAGGLAAMLVAAAATLTGC